MYVVNKLGVTDLERQMQTFYSLKTSTLACAGPWILQNCNAPNNAKFIFVIEFAGGPSRGFVPIRLREVNDWNCGNVPKSKIYLRPFLYSEMAIVS